MKKKEKKNKKMLARDPRVVIDVFIVKETKIIY
jgi:hypothetical protein